MKRPLLPSGEPRRGEEATLGTAASPALWLGVILVLAAVLRFTGLSWGLRHTPYHDERAFVDNVAQMVVNHDLDHRFYQYPGLVFYLLLPLLKLVRAQVPPGPEAYLVARGLVAVFGVMSVGLVYRLGRPLVGVRGALVAALFLAVSPLDVETAHMVRPDVILQCFVLLALLSFARTGPALAPDLLSGVALGAATAVKFTGGLLAPSYLAYRWLAPGPRLRRSVLVALLAAAVLVALTPYSVLHYHAYLAGVRSQWNWHYRGQGDLTAFLAMLLFYLRVIVEALGPLGAGLAVAGLLGIGSQWRAWLPLLVHLATTWLMHSTADRGWERFLVPSMGVLVLLVARGVEAFRSALPRSWPVILGAALVPLGSSLGYLGYTLTPGAWDRAVDWIDANVPPGSRIVNALPALGLDRSRFEVVRAPARLAAARLLALHSDVLILEGNAAREIASGGLQEAFRAGPTRDDPPIAIFLVPPELRPQYQPVPLVRAFLTASENEAQLAGVLDDDPATAWSTGEAQRPGAWIQVDLPGPVVLGRIDLGLGEKAARFGRDIHLLVTADGRSWIEVRTFSGRPPPERQHASRGEKSEVLVIEPLPVRGVRLVQIGSADKRWGVARLRLDALP